jgi:hypothetical protein
MNSLEIDGIPHLAAQGIISGITCLVGALVHNKKVACRVRTSRHEAQILQAIVLAKRRQDFFPAADFDLDFGLKFQHSLPV